jgi:hypothetical protein
MLFEIVGASVVGAGVVRTLAKCLTKRRLRNIPILDSDANTLAEAYLVSGELHELQVESESPTFTNVTADTVVVGEIVCGTADLVLYTGPSSSIHTPNDAVALDTEPIKVRCHRRVRKGHRGHFQADVLAALKVRFSKSTRNEANLAAVRRMAIAQMDERGVRPTEQRKIIASLVEMVFVPDQYECQAEKWRHSAPVQERHALYADYSNPGCNPWRYMQLWRLPLAAETQ